MATSTPQLDYFMIKAMDVPNSERVKHTELHVAQNTPLISSGIIRAGGGLLPQDVKSSDANARQNIIGSFIIVQATSIDAVWETIKKDIFYTSGEVWDHEKITVTPAYMAIKQVTFD
ncbi:hypothetical protein C2E23DRAFT_721954 [Lenzites betulinus]|nr:hypothetical protein C2E23DRAFT_721954 [Lenzites betulinus]